MRQSQLKVPVKFWLRVQALTERGVRWYSGQGEMLEAIGGRSIASKTTSPQGSHWVGGKSIDLPCESDDPVLVRALLAKVVGFTEDKFTEQHPDGHRRGGVTCSIANLIEAGVAKSEAEARELAGCQQPVHVEPQKFKAHFPPEQPPRVVYRQGSDGKMTRVK